MSRRHECSKQDQDHHDVVAQLSLSLFFSSSILQRSVQHSAWWKEEAPVAVARVDGRADGLGGLGAWRGTGWWPGSAGTVMRISARAERYPCTLPRYVPHQTRCDLTFQVGSSRAPWQKPPSHHPHIPTDLHPPMPVIMRLQQYCGRRRRRSQVVKINHPAHPARPLAPPFFSPYIVPRTIITPNSLRLYWSRRPSH